MMDFFAFLRSFFLNNIPCYLYQVTSGIFLNIGVDLVALNSWKLYITFNLTQDTVTYLKRKLGEGNFQSDDIPWFIRNRRLWTQQFVILIIVIDTVITITPMTLTALTEMGPLEIMTLVECSQTQSFRVAGTIANILSTLITLIQCKMKVKRII